jgi:ribosome-binding protein aMBF1 (putative translation factor)
MVLLPHMVTMSTPLVAYFGKLRIVTPMTDDELARVIADNVKAARTARAMTQGVLSERTGIAVPHISRMEKGGHLPSVATLKKVAEALEVPICALLEPPPPPKKGRRG